jgi:hypothetical protein
MEVTYIILLILATLAVALFFRKRSLLCTPLYIGFLFFTLTIETIAHILKYTYNASNHGVYNVYIYVSFICWFWWLTKKENAKPQLSFWISSTLLIAAAIIENLFIVNLWGITSLAFAVGTLTYVILFILKIYKAFAISDTLIPGYELIFLCAGLGFYVSFFLDILLYPTGLLSNPFWNGYTLDQIISRVVNFYYYFAMAFSIWLGVPKHQNAPSYSRFVRK